MITFVKGPVSPYVVLLVEVFLHLVQTPVQPTSGHIRVKAEAVRAATNWSTHIHTLTHSHSSLNVEACYIVH